LPKKRKKAEEKTVRIDDGDLFGLVLRLLGGSWIEVYCSDDIVRKVRIPRSKRSVRVRENDIIVVRPWYGIDESRADLKDRLLPRHIRMLLQSEHKDSILKVMTDELKELYEVEA